MDSLRKQNRQYEKILKDNGLLQVQSNGRKSFKPGTFEQID